MNIHRVIQSQYLAALAMLKQAIVKCPPDIWDAPRDKDRFWFKAYHALYYTHLYLHDDRKDFVPWRIDGRPVGRVHLSKEQILEYLDLVEQEVFRRVPAINLEANAGFRRSRIDKLEFQFIIIRHIQQHAGELYERLGARRNIKLDWAEHRHRERKQEN